MLTSRVLVRALSALLVVGASPFVQGCGSSETGGVEVAPVGATPTTPGAANAAGGTDTVGAREAAAASAAPSAAPDTDAVAAAEDASTPVSGPLPSIGRDTPVAAVVAGANGPLAAELRAHFAAIRPDPAPPAIVRASHYYRTNELSHDVYRERITELGGVMAGVGSDQLYLMAGWARPEVLVPLDFDAEIPATHRVFAAVFLATETPEAFIERFADEHEDALLSLVRTHYAGSSDVDALVRTARNARGPIYESLRMVKRRYRQRGVPTYVTDAAQYAFVRSLWAEGRVFPVRGDLTADITMLDLALAARRAGLPLRLLYVSNAETYFEFGPAYRRNIIAQPFDERSVFLRTFHSNLPHPEGEPNYHYNIETGPHVIAMMRASSIDSVRTLLVRARSATPVRGLSEITAAPEGGPQPIAPLPAGHPLAALFTPPG